ncbi:hypothetical protein HDU96_000429 [Phlyctochytrium bullatum]|nr:hypothetical protein HDU96_000429 [Phlyctochytrium bullatum]
MSKLYTAADFYFEVGSSKMYWGHNYADATAWYMSHPEIAPRWLLFDAEGHSWPVRPDTAYSQDFDSRPLPPAFPAPIAPPMPHFVSPPPMPPQHAYVPPYAANPTSPPRHRKPRYQSGNKNRQHARKDSAVSINAFKMNPMAQEFVPLAVAC